MTLETISIAMNKRIFYLVKLKFVAIILLIPFHIAQSQVYFGIKAGVNLSSVILINGEYSGRITGSNQHLLGYQVGGIAHISISESVGFRPEVVISRKGTRKQR